MKIRVECRATVEVDVTVTVEQLRQLEAGEIEIDDLIDESAAYRALRDGDFEFVDWEPIASKRKEAASQ